LLLIALLALVVHQVVAAGLRESILDKMDQSRRNFVTELKRQNPAITIATCPDFISGIGARAANTNAPNLQPAAITARDALIAAATRDLVADNFKFLFNVSGFRFKPTLAVAVGLQAAYKLLEITQAADVDSTLNRAMTTAVGNKVAPPANVFDGAFTAVAKELCVSMV
jgi:hypothetical protein